MIYLASPISSDSEMVRRDRFDRASELTAALLDLGRHVFCPDTYGCPLAERFALPGSWDFWRELDLDFLDRCNELWIYMLPGWEASTGVSKERAHAKATAKPTTYLSTSGACVFIEMAERKRRGIQ